MATMTQFRAESTRVKGIALHPTRPWVLASQFDGTIQLYDYRTRMSVHKFTGHSGPVRGIDFHPTQPIFVSGGDDHKIKVWSYALRKCLFTLRGHSDYVRTTFFHPTCPWIISASDDQTIRIWNWQSRTSIAVLTGHSHYVTCAQFHPKDDLVVSASIDQTLRVWDISGLCKKYSAPRIPVSQLEKKTSAAPAVPTTPVPATKDNKEKSPDRSLLSSSLMHIDLFGQPDAIVKHVLEGHTRGVNWASFHPTAPLIVSSSDDKQVKLWRYNDSRAWEVDSCRGHSNNVFCVIFHPHCPFIISTSEDKDIRLWEMGKRSCVKTIRNDPDRVWCLAAHPAERRFASGHDSGLSVFKFQRERPPYYVDGDHIYYVKDRDVRRLDMRTKKDLQAIVNIKNCALFQPYHSLHKFEPGCYLVVSRGKNPEGSTVDTYKVLRAKGKDTIESRRFPGMAALWMDVNRVLVLEKTRQLFIRGIGSSGASSTSDCKILPDTKVDNLFSAGTGFFLFQTDSWLKMFDLTTRQVVSSLQVHSRVRYVVWSSDQRYAALLGKRTLTLVTRDLKTLCTVEEVSSIKSGAWDDSCHVFVYATASHMRYLLTSGDRGIIRTLDLPVYIVAIRNGRLFLLNKSDEPLEVTLDPTEYKFKLALINRQSGEVEQIIKSGRLVGESMIAYMHKRGSSEAALQFVNDARTRFHLALECNKIEEASEAAKTLNQKDVWESLAEAALKCGDVGVLELAYRGGGEFEKLAFLYLITGNLDKLRTLRDVEVASDNKSAHKIFQASLYLGDGAMQIKALKDSKQWLFAYLAAKTHGLEEDAVELGQTLEAEGRPLPAEEGNAKPMAPPPPVKKYKLD